jgi:hypothetical protein
MIQYSDEIHRSDDVPDHVNDRNGILSMIVLGVVIALLVVLIIAISQAVP